MHFEIKFWLISSHQTSISRNIVGSLLFRNEIISIFQRAIVLLTYSPTECISGPTCLVGVYCRSNGLQTIAPTSSRTIDTVVTSSAPLVLVFVGQSIHQLRPVYRWSYCLLDYRYSCQKHFTVSPTFCNTIDTLVKTSFSPTFCRKQMPSQWI